MARISAAGARIELRRKSAPQDNLSGSRGRAVHRGGTARGRGRQHRCRVAARFPNLPLKVPGPTLRSRITNSAIARGARTIVYRFGTFARVKMTLGRALGDVPDASFDDFRAGRAIFAGTAAGAPHGAQTARQAVRGLPGRPWGAAAWWCVLRLGCFGPRQVLQFCLDFWRFWGRFAAKNSCLRIYASFLR